MINSVTRQYLEQCQDADGGLRDAVRRAPLPASFREMYQNRFADRPWFAEAELLDGFAAELEQFIDLLITSIHLA